MSEREFVDFAYKTGAGRYIQEPCALDFLAAEVLRFGTRAFVLAGPNGYAAAGALARESLEREGVPFVLELSSKPAGYEEAERCARQAAEAGCNVVVGIGGGRIMDAAKAVAATGGWPVVEVPTSIATCAAFTPLSVMYGPEGGVCGTWRYEREVDAVVVDGRVMASQPARLIAAGIMDSLAKILEISHGKQGLDMESESAQRYCAYRYALVNGEILERFGEEACRDAAARRASSAIERVVFANLALTGMVSSLTRGFHQTALAHRFYDGMRGVFGERVAGYLHGELVSIGLLMQAEFNGSSEQVESLRCRMRAMKMPCSVLELGIERDDEGLDRLRESILASEFVGEDADERARFEEAFKVTLG